MMMRHGMHSVHGRHDRRHDDRPEPDERERMLDAVGWAALFIWVGAAWLAGLEFGYILLGLGIVMLLDQVARYVLAVRVEVFWVLIGCGFFVAGYWELWDLNIPIAPVLLILAGIGLLAWQFLLHRR